MHFFIDQQMKCIAKLIGKSTVKTIERNKVFVATSTNNKSKKPFDTIESA